MSNPKIQMSNEAQNPNANRKGDSGERTLKRPAVSASFRALPILSLMVYHRENQIKSKNQKSKSQVKMQKYLWLKSEARNRKSETNSNDRNSKRSKTTMGSVSAKFSHLNFGFVSNIDSRISYLFGRRPTNTLFG